MRLVYKALPWLSLIGLQTLVLHRLGLDWQTAGRDAAVSGILLALTGAEIGLMYRFYQPGRQNHTWRFVFGVILAVLYCVLLHYLAGWLLPNSPEYVQFLDASMPVRFVFALMVIYLITQMFWIQSRLSEQTEMEKRQLESEQLMKEAELVRLRQQLHPHFLFNSLNSINALIGRQPEAARKMTQQLSDFLRGTLKKEDKPVQLKEELEHLCLYLEIEKVRFGSRLEVVFSTSPESLEKTLPALLLQPLVENAIKFGLYDLTEEVQITLTSSLRPDFLVIEIRNPFDPTAGSAGNGVGFGLQSIRRRLQLLYARQDLLSTEKQGNLFITTLKLPALS